MIVSRFAKYLTAVEYPKEKTSWNIAGILKDKNAFYKFDVRDMKRESDNHLFQTGKTDTKADKMVFEFNKQWVIIDIEELHKYIEEKKDKECNIFLVCIQAEEERKEQEKNRKKRSIAGKLGAKKRWSDETLGEDG